MSLIDYLQKNACEFYNKEAIVYVYENGQKDVLTWHEFDNLVNMVASKLIHQGVLKGDKVGILSPNSPIWLPVYFGILKAGAVAVPLNYNENEDIICFCLNKVNCKILFISQEYKNYVSLVSKCNMQAHIIELAYNIKTFVDSLNDTPLHNNFCFLDNQDDAAIYFSSGTTGVPKAILLSHHALLTAAKTELNHHNQTPKDRFLCLSPLFHTGAKIHWFGSFLVGGCIVITPYTTPMEIIEVINQEKITIVFLLVPQIQDIVDILSLEELNIKKNMLSSLRLMHTGAQPVPSSLIKKWLTLFPNMLYDISYGLTEVSGPGCIHLGFNNIHKMESIGLPDPNWEIDIIDKNGFSVENGQFGELLLKGPSIMKGYYHDKDSTERTIKNGWLHTGDIAYTDYDGFVYLIDRKKDIVISGGENIYPIQIENHIRTLQCVKDVAVIGLSNVRMGEIVVAVIELKPNMYCTKKEIFDHCMVLPPYKRPVKIFFDSIIRNSTGKIDKKVLKNKYTKKNTT